MGLAKRVFWGVLIGIACALTWEYANRVWSDLPAAGSQSSSPKQVGKASAGAESTRTLPPGKNLIDGSEQPGNVRAEKDNVGFSVEQQPKKQLPKGLVAATPYESVVQAYSKEEALESSVSDLMYHHFRVLNSEDDPSWSRPMEKQLFEYIQRIAGSEVVEVSSIVCRKVGCELQIIYDVADLQTPSAIWLGLASLSHSLVPLNDRVKFVDGRQVQVTYVKHRE